MDWPHALRKHISKQLFELLSFASWVRGHEMIRTGSNSAAMQRNGPALLGFVNIAHGAHRMLVFAIDGGRQHIVATDQAFVQHLGSGFGGSQQTP